jgi:hypothetical protein
MWIWSNGYGVLLTHILAVMAGFLLGAALFLGHGQARTTEDVRNGLVADRRAARGRRCTGVTARWCPLHGHCTCKRGDDDTENEGYEISMDDPNCPLHGERSLHAAEGQ